MQQLLTVTPCIDPRNDFENRLNTGQYDSYAIYTPGKIFLRRLHYGYVY